MSGSARSPTGRGRALCYPPRFCTPPALMNDGHVRQVNFSIIEDGGLASYGSGVDFCVVGLDRNWAYNPACKAGHP
jgi:hypothetical protein